MTSGMDPNQTAPIEAVWSGSTLFASILKLVSNVNQLFAADGFSRRHFSDAFFLGALRVKSSTHQIPIVYQKEFSKSCNQKVEKCQSKNSGFFQNKVLAYYTLGSF